jgi:hypothetical protein
MDEVPIGSAERRMVQQFLANYDAPAYIRRARRVQDAWDQLVNRCRRQRDEWLVLVRIRLGLLHALAGDWSALSSWLADEQQWQQLRELHEILQPQLRCPPVATSSTKTLERALRQLRASIEIFNSRWQSHLAKVDLEPVNRLRAEYNRYYLLEKECAVRSARLARQGYRPLEPMTLQDLSALLPCLPVLQFRR